MAKGGCVKNNETIPLHGTSVSHSVVHDAWRSGVLCEMDSVMRKGLGVEKPSREDENERSPLGLPILHFVVTPLQPL